MPLWIRKFGAWLLCLGVLPATSAEPLRDTRPAEKFTLTKDEQAILDLTNEERAKEKLPPLKPNEKLFKAAREHSANMAKQEMMEHILDEKSPVDRVKATGYVHMRLAENIASGQRKPEQVVEAWMKSEEHKKNILNQDFTEIGIGIAKSEKGKLYFTQVFARPLRR